MTEVTSRFSFRRRLRLRTSSALAVILLLLTGSATFAQNRLCFPLVTGVPNNPIIAPTIDGVTDNDPGWTGCFRYVMNNGTSTPDAIVQGNRDSKYLYLSFEVNEISTSINDTIMLTFSPDHSNHANDVRIIINPVNSNLVLSAAGGVAPVSINLWKDSTTWNAGTAPVSPIPGWLLADSSGNNIRVTYSGTTTAIKYIVEMRIPLVSSAAGPGINLPATGDFGFYFDIIRANNPDPVGTTYLDELPWPANAPYVSTNPTAVNDPGTPQTNTPAPSSWGAGTFDNNCSGVWFVWSDIKTNNSPTSFIDPSSSNNVFSVDLHNSGTAPATGVHATFFLADFGINSVATQFQTQIPVGNNPKPPLNMPGTTINTGASTITTLATDGWDLLHNPSAAAPYLTTATSHQCILVTLDSTGDPAGTPTLFLNKSVVRNMDFVEAPPGPNRHIQRVANINLAGFEAAPNGKKLQNVMLDLNALEQKIAVPQGVPATRATSDVRVVSNPVSAFTWEAHGYRETGRVMKLGKTLYHQRERMGAFGFILPHDETSTPQWKCELAGEGIKRVSDTRYMLEVPNDKAVLLTASFDAAPVQPPGNTTGGPVAVAGGIAWWLWILLLILILAVVIFFLKKKKTPGMP